MAQAATKTAAAAPAAEAPKTEATAAAVKQAMAEVLPPIAPLLASEIWAHDGGVKFNTFEVVPPSNTPIGNLARPDFWANVSQRLTAGSTIIAFPRDGAWYAELVVKDAGQNWAHVVSKCLIAEWPEFDRVTGVALDFEIRRDPIDGWCVLKRSTGARVKSNLSNAEDARKWILDHQRVLRS